MRAKAGDVTVFVEQKNDTDGVNFGQGTGEWTTFGAFLTRWWESDEPSKLQSYMNIQTDDAQLRLLFGPLARLSNDFSAPNWFLANRLYSANLWIGRSDPVSGQRSQLHHDYHDNLYTLLKGRKELLLFSPADTPNLYPRGRPEYVSPTGVIE